jgi:hypothetical protein
LETEFAIEILCWNILVPAGISVAVLFISRLILPTRYAAAIAFATAFITGYGLLEWAKIVPERHYQWLPWIPVLTLVPLAMSLAEKIGKSERAISYTLPAALTAFFIVPTWERLNDASPAFNGKLSVPIEWELTTRWMYLIGVTVTVWLLCCVMDLLASRMRPGWFVALFAICVGGMAGTIMPLLSIKFGQILLCACGAATGVGLLSLKSKDSKIGRAVAPHLAIVMSCGAFLAFVDPNPAQYAYLAPLAIPLVCVPFVVGPLARYAGIKLAVLQVLLAITIIGGSGWWIHSQNQTTDQYGDYGY